MDFQQGDIVMLTSGGPTMTVLELVANDPEQHIVCGVSTLFFGYKVHSIRALGLQFKQRKLGGPVTFTPGDLVALKSGGAAFVVLDFVPNDPTNHVVCGVSTSFTGYQVHSIPAVALQPIGAGQAMEPDWLRMFREA